MRGYLLTFLIHSNDDLHISGKNSPLVPPPRSPRVSPGLDTDTVNYHPTPGEAASLPQLPHSPIISNRLRWLGNPFRFLFFLYSHVHILSSERICEHFNKLFLANILGYSWNIVSKYCPFIRWGEEKLVEICQIFVENIMLRLSRVLTGVYFT